jgi:hypothetical protein
MTEVRRERPMNNRELVDLLCADSSTLREARRRHLEKFGALIPHVFMGEVLEYVGTCVYGVPPGAQAWATQPELAAILDTLERGMLDGDREARNVIALSFVRDAESEHFSAALRPLLGRLLRAQSSGA